MRRGERAATQVHAAVLAIWSSRGEQAQCRVEEGNDMSLQESCSDELIDVSEDVIGSSWAVSRKPFCEQ